MVSIIRKVLPSVVLAAALMVTGCTHTYKIPDVSLRNQGGEYAIDKKIDLAVNLCLTEEFKGTRWEKRWMGETFVLPIGNQLVKNTTELAEILFGDVVLTCTPAARTDKQPEAILTPKVVAIERTFGLRTYYESVLTLTLQWKMEDLQKNPIWIDSIKGEGRGESHPIFNEDSNSEAQVGMALKELFGKSLQAIRTSPEIRQFVEKNRPATN